MRMSAFGTKQTCALRDFDPAFVRFESKADFACVLIVGGSTGGVGSAH
jgi:hypothetical protein